MTIKEKIDAYVLAQGNQVGAGAEFASLLKEIVDSIPGGGGAEPLYIKAERELDGDQADVYYHCTATYDELKAAALAKRPICMEFKLIDNYTMGATVTGVIWLTGYNDYDRLLAFRTQNANMDIDYTTQLTPFPEG